MKRLSSYTPRAIKQDWKERIRALARTAAEETATRRSAEVTRSLLEPLVRQVEETNATLEQWAAIWRHEGALPPPPPKHLQVRVVGAYVPGFIESGYSICQDLGAALTPAGKRLADFPTILDFGCGCGRVIRALKSLLPTANLHGTDIDPEAIGWLTANYGRFGAFAVAPHQPPLPYADRTFDFVAGLSVFTHLPEDMQFAWLRELRRITKPGGYLVLTTHGETHYGKFPEEPLAIMKEKGFYYSDFGFNYGKSINLPDFYQTSFHSHDYIRREWGKHFEILHIEPLALQQHQDTVLLRNTR